MFQTISGDNFKEVSEILAVTRGFQQASGYLRWLQGNSRVILRVSWGFKWIFESI